MIIFDEQLRGGVCLADLSVPPSVPLSCPSESSLRAVLHQSVFLSAMSPQPGRDLSLCWEQHRKLLPGVSGETAESVQRWSVQQVRVMVPRRGGGLPQQKYFLSLPPSLTRLSLCLSLRPNPLQVADFVESLPGCEEQSRQFRDEVS